MSDTSTPTPECTSVPLGSDATGSQATTNGNKGKGRVSMDLLHGYTDMGDSTVVKSYKRETKHR